MPDPAARDSAAGQDGRFVRGRLSPAGGATRGFAERAKSRSRQGCPIRRRKIGGQGRNRTGVHGFAGRCMTTLPPGPGGADRLALLAARPRESPVASNGQQKARPRHAGSRGHGAGNETRTRDPDLGKVVLYQLSYSRNATRDCRGAPRGVKAHPRVPASPARRRADRPLPTTASAPPPPATAADRSGRWACRAHPRGRAA